MLGMALISSIGHEFQDLLKDHLQTLGISLINLIT